MTNCTRCDEPIKEGKLCDKCEATLVEATSRPTLSSLYKRAKERGLISDSPQFGS